MKLLSSVNCQGMQRVRLGINAALTQNTMGCGAPTLQPLPPSLKADTSILPQHVTCVFPAQFQSCLLKMVCCGHHPWRTGKTTPAAPGPRAAITADGLRNKVTPSQPV